MKNLFLLFSQYLNLISPTTTVHAENSKIPIIVNTWGFTNATVKAWDVINRQKKSAVSLMKFNI